MSDLELRLRAFAGNPFNSAASNPDVLGMALIEAANELEACRAERAELIEALRELAQAADHVGSTVYDWQRLLPERIAEARALLAKLEGRTGP